MPKAITMPALSPTMTEGTLAKWLKQEGDSVSAGDVVAEIETDKATMEVEAVDEGRLGKILVPAGTGAVAVNTTIGLILEAGESAADLATADLATPDPVTGEAATTEGSTTEGSTPDGAASAPPPAGDPAVTGVAPATGASSAPAAVPLANGSPPTAAAGPKRLFASPLARRMAAEAGLDLAGITGSGPHGRIVRADVVAARTAPPAAPDAAPVPPVPPVPDPARATGQPPPVPGMPGFELVPHSTMRQIIARRLSDSKHDVPHFYLTVDCEIDRLLACRKDLNARMAGEGKLSVNDLIIRATGLALHRVPEANASWTEEGVRRYDRADVSVAVAVEGGLLTPVIRDAGRRGLRSISDDMKSLAGKARAGRLAPEDYQGGTFSLSNLGMFGVREFAAIINQPQACILAVGAGTARPVVRAGELAVATVMTCTLSVDHRVVDGAVGAAWLAAFKALIEDPLTMLL